MSEHAPPPNPDDLLTITQVAELLQHRVSHQSISAWCRKGLLPARRAGLKWIIRRADIDTFLERERGTTHGHE